MSLFVIPRCKHDNIILGCPDDSCEEQNAYLAQQQEAWDRYEERGRLAAREIVREVLGIPFSAPKPEREGEG